METYDVDCDCGKPAIAFHSLGTFCEECLGASTATSVTAAQTDGMVA